MMKRGIRAALLILCLMLLTGCAGKPQQLPGALDLAHLLADKAGGGMELGEVPSQVMAKLLMLEEGELAEGVMVMDQSRATTTQFVVLTAGSEAGARKLEAGFKDYQAHVLSQYRNYVPSEVPRIEKALIRRQGLQSVFVICDDVKLAEQVLNQYWK